MAMELLLLPTCKSLKFVYKVCKHLSRDRFCKQVSKVKVCPLVEHLNILACVQLLHPVVGLVDVLVACGNKIILSEIISSKIVAIYYSGLRDET